MTGRSKRTNVPMRPARREYSPRARVMTLALLAPVFLVALPCVFVGLGAGLDRRMQWPQVLPEPANLVVGIPLLLAGGLLGLWSNHRLLTTGRGTPLPLMPTQELIIGPPYSRSRNPMALGAISMYLGVAVLFQSLGSVLVVVVCAAALLSYVRFFEERELAARFGAEYGAYRHRTPFLIPRPRNRRHDRC